MGGVRLGGRRGFWGKGHSGPAPRLHPRPHPTPALGARRSPRAFLPPARRLDLVGCSLTWRIHCGARAKILVRSIRDPTAGETG